MMGLIRSRAFEFQAQIAQLIDQSGLILAVAKGARLLISAVDVLYNPIIRLFIPNYI